MRPKHTDDKRERFRTEKRRVIRTVLSTSAGVFVVLGAAFIWTTGWSLMALIPATILSISLAVIGIVQAPDMAREALMEEWVKEQWPDSDEKR